MGGLAVKSVRNFQRNTFEEGRGLKIEDFLWKLPGKSKCESIITGIISISRML